MAYTLIWQNILVHADAIDAHNNFVKQMLPSILMSMKWVHSHEIT